MKDFSKKGQVGSIVALIVGLIVAVILLIGVLTPIISTVVNNVTYVAGGTNITGVQITIANSLNTFVLLGVLVLIAGVAVFGLARKG